MTNGEDEEERTGGDSHIAGGPPPFEKPIPPGYVAVEGGYLLRDPNYTGPIAGDEDPSGTGQDDDC